MMAEIKGVSPDAETVTNEKGGKQSKTAYAFHLCDTGAMLALAEIMQYGASRYARDNWRKIPAEEHFNHMLIHYYAWLQGDTSDDHLAHMFCRAMMLYATGQTEREAQKAEEHYPYTVKGNGESEPRMTSEQMDDIKAAVAQYTQGEPLTVWEHMRAGTAEEAAETIYPGPRRQPAVKAYCTGRGCSESGDCADCYLEWLNSPYKEDI